MAGRPLSVQALVVVHTGFVAPQLSCSLKEDIQNFLLNQAFLSTLGRVLLGALHSDSEPILHCALLNSAYIGSSCQDLWLCGCCESESEVAQSCPTLCDPVGCNLSGSSVHGIFQAIALEWIAISFSSRSSRPRDRTQVSCIVDALPSEPSGK